MKTDMTDIRMEKLTDQIFVISPYAEMGRGPRSPRGQIETIMSAIPSLCKELGLKTILYDTVTSTADEVVAEIARSKVNKDDTSKHYTIMGKEGELCNTPGINWRDNGMAQNIMRYNVRNPLLKNPDPVNVLLLGHEVEKDNFIGLNAGGPASIRDFGNAIGAYMWVGSTKGKRYLATQQFENRLGQTVKAKCNFSPDSDIPAMIEIPSSFKECVEVWEMITKGQDIFRGALFGHSGVGKSTLASAFLGLPDKLPVLVIMSDNQTELPSWWSQVKDKK